MDSLAPSQEPEETAETCCFSCKHLIEWPYCFAFLAGEGIPHEIRMGKFHHSLPYPGDHGIGFTPVDSPYDISETALKRLLIEYRGQRIMPDGKGISCEQSEHEAGPVDECVAEGTEPEELVIPSSEPPSQKMVDDLLEACGRGDLGTVRTLIGMGVDTEVSDSMGNTALMIACRACQMEVVAFLLEKGADVHARNSYFRTAMDIASDWGYPSIINLLRAHGAKESDTSAF